MLDHEAEKDTHKAKFSPKAWISALSHLGKFKKQFALIGLFMVLTSLVDIAFPLFQGYLIDNFIEKRTVDGIWLFSAGYLAFIVVQILAIMFFIRFCIQLELNILEVFRNKIFRKFQELPVAYFNNRSVGYLVAKTMSDTERIGNTLSWGFLDIGINIIYIVGIFIPMFMYSRAIALVLMLIIPLSLLLSMLFERKLLRQNRIIRDLNSKVAGALNEGITGAKTVKSLNAEQKLSGEFRKQTKEMCMQSFKYNRLNSLYVSLLIFLGAFAVATVLTVGGSAVQLNGMSVGRLAVIVTYASSLVNPVMQLAETLTNLVANQANVERTVNLLNEVPKIQDSPEVIEKYGDFFHPKRENWENMIGEIEFRNVSFKYDGDERYILKDFNLKIPAGTNVALVGETGAGKTTIVNLICRFYEPTEGEILIDGVDIRKRSQLWLFSHLGYVLQTPHLFSGTIESNIKYGRPDASDEDMYRAAELVAVDKLVQKLPNGYKSSIGECGDSLSTGEKQLITFARAILSDPRLIILDEATSSIDTHTETLIQNAIQNILNKRTSIMIAHRLSTIKNADMILLIDDGKIKEQGNHKQLMQLQGEYHKLYTKLFEQSI